MAQAAYSATAPSTSYRDGGGGGGGAGAPPRPTVDALCGRPACVPEMGGERSPRSRCRVDRTRAVRTGERCASLFAIIIAPPSALPCPVPRCDVHRPRPLSPSPGPPVPPVSGDGDNSAQRALAVRAQYTRRTAALLWFRPRAPYAWTPPLRTWREENTRTYDAWTVVYYALLKSLHWRRTTRFHGDRSSRRGGG
jgi:hypothetical protein